MNQVIKIFTRNRSPYVRFKYCLSVIVVGYMLTGSAFAQSWQINPETWASPRNGLRLLEIKPLSAAVSALNKMPHSTLQVGFPGTETGILWANELRDWLVALGVPSTRIQLIEQPREDHLIKLSLNK